MPLAINTQNLHPSTAACLEMMQALQEHPFTNILDIGCGNGILSLVAAHAWPGDVLAVDIAQKAVDETLRAIASYGLQDRVNAIRSDGFSHPLISKTAPYDLILCNLLADVQLRFALDIKNHLAQGGFCILSGILEWRAGEMEQAAVELGLAIESKIVFSPWVAYTLHLKKT